MVDILFSVLTNKNMLELNYDATHEAETRGLYDKIKRIFRVSLPVSLASYKSQATNYGLVKNGSKNVLWLT